MRRRFSFLVFLLAVASCRQDKSSDFVLRVAVPGPLEPFSAAIGNSYITAAQDLVFDTFLMPDERGEMTSRVLRRWERVDGRHYRIQLDPSLRFSDGSPVALEDVVESMASQQLRATVRDDWVEIESNDSSRLIEPALLFTLLYRKTTAGPLGTGAFRVAGQNEKGIVLERIRPLPRRIRRVEILAYPTPREVLARVIRGDANAAVSLDERQLELTEGIPRLKPIRNVSPNSLTVLFNSRRFDATTRRRLASALPINDIAKLFAEGCRSESAAEPLARYQKLPPGRRLDVLVSNWAVSMDRVALLVRRSLGIRGGEVVRTESSRVVELWKAGTFDVFVLSLSNWPDAVAADMWRVGGPLNYMHYSNPRVNEAFDRGDFAAAKAELKADVAFVEICRRERIGVVDSRIKNPRMGWWGILDTLPDWEVDE